MNRTILILICDFLLVSLLAFSTIDINKISDEVVDSRVQTLTLTNQAAPEAGKDLTAVMRMALDDEKKSRDLLMGELERARVTITERERQVQQTRQALQTREQEAARLESTRTNLQTQFSSAQANVQELSQKLAATTTEATTSREKLAAMEAELKKRAAEAAALQTQMSSLARSNQTVLAERQQLATRLQVAEVERQHAAEQVVKMAEQVKVEREEKAKLSENVKVLASQSGQLAQEVRENRPLAPNTIFNEFAENRVQARIAAFKPGLIDVNRRRDTETVLVTNGTNTYALAHVSDTPFSLTAPSTDWESISGALVRGNAQVPIRTVSFHLQDPRMVLIPVSQEAAKQLGSKIYKLSKDPFKFQDVVLVGTREAYYGECRFQIDLTTPDYLRLDNSFIKGLFGRFNPSKGDLVFSRTGELIGVMVNGGYCLVLRSFDAAATLQFSKDVRSQQTGSTFSLLGNRVLSMPPKLQ